MTTEDQPVSQPGASSELSLVESFQAAQRRLILQSSDFALASLAQLVSSNSIDVSPRFQRRDRWDAYKQSALIESFLLNLPIPPVYLAEEGGKYAVIDGRQRLTALRDFFDDQLVLRNLEELPGLEGLRFSGLPREIRDALSMRPLRTVTLLAQTHPDLKYLVFHRLNTAGEVLNQQEIRNVIYRGPLNDLLFELSTHHFLKQQLKVHDEDSAAYRKMQDVEFVLRFLTLRRSWGEFSGNLAWSMDEFMFIHQRAAPNELKVMREDFEEAIDTCAAIWGEHAFQRPEGTSWRLQTLAGLYDAQMISVREIDQEQVTVLKAKSAEVIDITRELFDDPDFDKAVRTGTNTPARIKTRIEMLTSALRAAAVNGE